MPSYELSLKLHQRQEDPGKAVAHIHSRDKGRAFEPLNTSHERLVGNAGLSGRQFVKRGCEWALLTAGSAMTV